MVTISGVFSSIFEILKNLVPVGVDPIYFWLTLILSFGIIFLLLQLLPLFNDKRGIAFIVALVMSYFVASSAFATIVIAKLFPNIGLAIMAILGLLMVIALLSPGSFKGGLKFTVPIALVAFIFVIFMTYSSVAPELAKAGFISPGLGTTISDNDVAMVIAAIIVVGLLYMLVAPKGDGTSTFGDKFFKLMGQKGW